MTIQFKPYRKKDGELMLYINGDNRVSVGISEGRGFSPYGKHTTKGQRNLYDAAMRALRDTPPVYEGDLGEHAEESVELDIGTLFVTDIATVGGVNVGADGAYLYAENKLYNLAYIGKK